MHSRPAYSSRRGSVLVTVIFFAAIMALLTGSILTYTISERRANERQRLVLRARNMSENISVYAAEQLTTKLMRLRSSSPMAFIGGSNQIHLPPDNVLTTAFSAPADAEVRAGLTATTGLAYVSDTTNPNYGLSVSTSTVPIISKATMRHSGVGAVTAYTRHDMEVAMIPLFQFGIFYNMDLEFFPGQSMTIAGPVHTNGRLMARGEAGGSAALTFTDRVTAAEGLYAHGQMKANYRTRAGSNPTDPGGTGAVYYTSTAGTQTNLYGTHSGSNKWRDQKMGGSSETSTTQNQFKTWSTSTYTNNVRTNLHGVTKLELPSIGTYKETNDPSTPEDDRNNGRQLIAAPASDDAAGILQSKIGRLAGLYIVVNPDDTTRTGKLPDASNITVLGRSYRAFLNVVNSDGTHTIREVVLPGQPSYGYNNNGTPADTSDDTMYQNNLPNRYTDKSSVGSNQVLRIPQSGRACDQPIAQLSGGGALTPASPNTPPAAGAFVTAAATQGAMPLTSFTGYAGASAPSFPNLTDAYFYDNRRANNNSGYPYNRSSNNYTPRPVAKIDFDLTRLQMMVDRTYSGATASTIYYPSLPTTAAQWGNFVFNPSATRSAYRLGINYDTITDYSGFPTDTTAAPNNYWADPFRLYFAPSDPTSSAITDDPNANFAVTASDLNSAWYDGVTVYIHSVDAEVRAQSSGTPARVDSGVRLWHGRGPVVSLSATGRTGFTFVTNDAAYIVGHFNADGTINSTTTSTGNGGYSARYPDGSSEKLACVMADAITILSQPTFTSSSGTYYQTSGWNDGFSAHAVQTDSSYSSSWQSSNPSSSNQYDGINTSRKPSPMPNLAAAGSLGSNFSEKLPTVNTEISCALLMGLVPSNHNPSGLTDGPPSSAANQQYSGGAHNFPRLIESWNGQGLYIRGSMVALFESRVAMEPWNLRVYTAPNRHWGLHQDLRNASHDIPLEPIVLSARRMAYREITASEYATLKTTIEALPH
jgi:hypothetical protein